MSTGRRDVPKRRDGQGITRGGEKERIGLKCLSSECLVSDRGMLMSRHDQEDSQSL